MGLFAAPRLGARISGAGATLEAGTRIPIERPPNKRCRGALHSSWRSRSLPGPPAASPRPPPDPANSASTAVRPSGVRSPTTGSTSTRRCSEYRQPASFSAVATSCALFAGRFCASTPGIAWLAEQSRALVCRRATAGEGADQHRPRGGQLPLRRTVPAQRPGIFRGDRGERDGVARARAHHV